MKKLAIALVLALVLAPVALSLASRYWLTHHLPTVLPEGAEITASNYDYGWLQSRARVDISLGALDLVIHTRNTIQHGPVIWRELFEQPSGAFRAYKIGTEFDLQSLNTLAPLVSDSGQAMTMVSYSGQATPIINHPGLEMAVLNSRVFVDLPESDLEFRTDGTSLVSLKANQLEVSSMHQNLYLVRPEIELLANPGWTIPESFHLSAPSLSGVNGVDTYHAGDLEIFTSLEHQNGSFNFSTRASSDSLVYNRAQTGDVSVELEINRLGQELVDYIAQNHAPMIVAAQSGQWLVLVKHAATLVQLIGLNQPGLKLGISGMHGQMPVEIDFSAALKQLDNTGLNPFTLLDNLQLRLTAQIPAALVDGTDNPELISLFQSLADKGLFINTQQSYYANLSLENGKLVRISQ